MIQSTIKPLNRRQERALSMMRSQAPSIHQNNQASLGAAWYGMSKTTGQSIRLKLTCRDVFDLTERGLIVRSDYNRFSRDLVKTEAR
ncbi:hypothetical protein HNP46_000300 [Pseudomonas nitritireducens]|uniref:Uncharacterized protein n=1 Tax=Pseudomonas nitroreducens TaxID=46680 RepID=A0A7W7KFQ8_PSENT|nr:hypothetical protein [Pseudomonas nitritireducens]MBB4861489.1 hypothetical protein [Pseudomonas nitritireducens]